MLWSLEAVGQRVTPSDAITVLDEAEASMTFSAYTAEIPTASAVLRVDVNNDALADPQDLVAWSRDPIDLNADGVADNRDRDWLVYWLRRSDQQVIDCDANGVPDLIEIDQGTLVDSDGDGLADACGLLPVFQIEPPIDTPVEQFGLAVALGEDVVYTQGQNPFADSYVFAHGVGGESGWALTAVVPDTIAEFESNTFGRGLWAFDHGFIARSRRVRPTDGQLLVVLSQVSIFNQSAEILSEWTELGGEFTESRIDPFSGTRIQRASENGLLLVPMRDVLKPPNASRVAGMALIATNGGPIRLLDLLTDPETADVWLVPRGRSASVAYNPYRFGMFSTGSLEARRVRSSGTVSVDARPIGPLSDQVVFVQADDGAADGEWMALPRRLGGQWAVRLFARNGRFIQRTTIPLASSASLDLDYPYLVVGGRQVYQHLGGDFWSLRCILPESRVDSFDLRYPYLAVGDIVSDQVSIYDLSVLDNTEQASRLLVFLNALGGGAPETDLSGDGSTDIFDLITRLRLGG